MEQFETENKNGMEAMLNEPLKMKKVITNSAEVAGFCAFFKTQEQSLESLKKLAESHGLPWNEEQFSIAMPHLKRTDAECDSFAKIEALAISKHFRRQGHGRTLIQNAIQAIKQQWPTITRVDLDVNANNDGARRLYESEGFIQSSIQPAHMIAMEIVQYEKAI